MQTGSDDCVSYRGMCRSRTRAPSPINIVVIGLCAMTLAGIMVGAGKPPRAPGGALTVWSTGIAWMRLGSVLAASVTLVFGPGLALACLRRRPAGQSVGYLALLGPALLAATGLLSWLLASRVEPQRVSAVMVAIEVLAIAVVMATYDARGAFDRHDLRAATIVAILLAVVAAKGVYSLGPVGELYHQFVSRTLEVGDRGDSRIPYHVVQLIANGISPFTARGQENFLPWSFSDRGPLAGVAVTPIVLVTGARVPVDPPNQPWTLFDPQGFAAYRLAMMTLAMTAVLAVYGTIRRLAGPSAGLFTTVLVATTPFVVHESFFTWPKLLTAGMIVLAGDLTLRQKPVQCGLMAGIAYLVHPMALLSVPTLAMLSLLQSWVPSLWGLRLWKAAWPIAQMGVGVGVGLVFWRVINGPRYTQGNFIQWAALAAGAAPVSVQTWFAERLASVLNTLVPGFMFIFFSQNHEVNAFQGTSPPIVHFFFQYWNTVPFAVGLLFFPVFLARLLSGFRIHKWTIMTLAIIPFVLFAIYWGFSVTGLMREGLHVWLLALLIVYGYLRFSSGPWAWELTWLGPALMASRAVESLVILVVPTIVTNHAVIGRLSDVLPLLVMFMGMSMLAREAWLLSKGELMPRSSLAWGKPVLPINANDEQFVKHTDRRAVPA